MGLLINGEWHRDWYDTAKTGGKFVREDTGFRNRISPEAGAPFPPQRGRYHLYVSHACPWCHRLTIVRSLKNLEDVISLSVTDPYMDEDGWQFSEAPGAIPDTVNHARRMYEVYRAAKPDYTGRVTVPVLWDKQTGRIVSNESSEILRMFNSAFDGLGEDIAQACPDLYPEHLRSEIDALNTRIYDTVNNGVYKCGFATTQEAYAAAFAPLLRPWTCWRSGCPTAATCWANSSPRPTGGSSSPSCASTRSTIPTSSATATGSPISPISSAT